MKKKPAKHSPVKDDSFESVAKRLECDEDKDRFEMNLKAVAHPKKAGKT